MKEKMMLKVIYSCSFNSDHDEINHTLDDRIRIFFTKEGWKYDGSGVDLESDMRELYFYGKGGENKLGDILVRDDPGC